MTAFLGGVAIAVVGWTSGPTAGADPASDPGAALLQQIPTALRTSCQPLKPGAQPRGTDAAVACTPHRVAAQHVLVLGFADPTAALTRYLRDGDLHKIPRDTDGDCFGSTNSESPFRTRDGVVGRAFCAHRDHSIEWTYGTVVARATGSNDNDLYIWWAHLVARTRNAAQQALFDQAPSGIDRSNCQDNGDASIKCTSPAANVYAVKYTRFPSGDALLGAYGTAARGAGLVLDVPPLRTRKSACRFETTWAATLSTAALGRIACFHSNLNRSYHLLWTIDSQQTLVEAYSPALSDVINFFKAFSTGNQTSAPSIRSAG